MKSVMMLLVTCFFFPIALASSKDIALGRSNLFLRFIASHQSIHHFALQTLISQRCSRYLPWPQEQGCAQAVKDELKILDYDIEFLKKKSFLPSSPGNEWPLDAFVFVAFKSDLLQILSRPQTTLYLEDLQKRLNDFLINKSGPVNVWETTLAHYKTPFEAAQIMAVLFQDISPMKLHLAFLERNHASGSLNYQTNRELLSQTIDNFNLILDYSEKSFRTLFYPQGLQEHLNRTIYHFYVPPYLSMALEKKGHSKDEAFMAPLMLTLTYEFITSSSGYQYIFQDPDQLDPVAFQWKLRDIYGGYTGGAFGSKRPLRTSFQDMSKAFSRSTAEAVELLLRP